MEQTNYDVFISYSRKDYLDENGDVRPNNIVSKIKSLLEKNAITYWFDEDGIYSGDSFGEKIAKMIKLSSVFVFISTKNSNASAWTSDEIATARSYNKKIIPFRYDDSIYNDSVILFIAKLDFIEYSKGEEKAFRSLLTSINNYKASLKQNEVRVEEEKAKKEKEKQQAKLVSEIKVETSNLLDLEKELEEKRDTIKKRIDLVDSLEIKEKLKISLVETNSEANRLQNDIDALLEEKTKLEEVIKSTKHKSCSRKIYLPVVISLSVLSIIFGGLYLDKEGEYQTLKELYYKQNEGFSQLCGAYPILITELSVTNSANQKNELDGKKTDYVYPHMSYNSFMYGSIELLIKIYEPDGQLSINEDASPNGYTTAIELFIREGDCVDDLSGWGYKEKGLWAKGEYRIEIWYKDRCLKTGKFYIQ